jgi:asparagine synthase (glutamine-hydrolysing)
MCGIVAVFNREAEEVRPDVLSSMRDAMTHRGPDDCGLFIDANVGLAHRRLSIIDLSPAGHQPMCNETGHVWITFNGEIYNFQSLRQELVNRGYRFRSRSDTEVILALYDLDGDTFVNRLNGIFAFALWDARKRRLCVARDRMGVKPLYIWRGQRTIAVASEIKALLVHPDVTRDVRHELVPEYLAFRQLAGNQTLLTGIEQLGPGHMLFLDEAGERTTRYWAASTHHEFDSYHGTINETVDKLDEQMAEVVSRQTLADVPLGTFNSGGVDSSLVTAYVSARSRDHLNTFAVGFDDPKLDERPFARVVADVCQTRHRSIVVDCREFADLLPTVVWHHDEPLSHPHTIQLYALSKLARQFVKVVLTGEGSDELFAGYPRYRSAVALGMLGPRGCAWGQRAAGLWPFKSSGRMAKAQRALALGPEGTVLEGARWVMDADLRSVLTTNESALRPQRSAIGRPRNLLTQMLEQDQQNYLQALLMRLDKVTMASSLEARVPFLDNQIVDFAATIPADQKIRRWSPKFVVRRLAERKLPKQLIRRRKMGFSVPLADWFRSSAGLGRYIDMLLEPRSLQRPYLDAHNVRHLLDAWRRGDAVSTDLLWGLVNLEVWQREVIERASRPHTPSTQLTMRKLTGALGVTAPPSDAPVDGGDGRGVPSMSTVTPVTAVPARLAQTSPVVSRKLPEGSFT